MAKTKKAKEKIVIDIEKIPERLEKPTVLSPDHLRVIEVQQREVENKKLEMHIEEQSLNNMQLKSQLLQLHIEKQKVLLQSKANEYTQAKAAYKNIKDDIFKEYEITGELFSYDAETGKIIT